MINEYSWNKYGMRLSVSSLGPRRASSAAKCRDGNKRLGSGIMIGVTDRPFALVAAVKILEASCFGKQPASEVLAGYKSGLHLVIGHPIALPPSIMPLIHSAGMIRSAVAADHRPIE
jgi:hypothetical protein